MTVYAGSTPPDKTTLIRWIRGEDNYGDELGPGKSGITVRPSIHGDVLHSRPLVLNYGDNRGIVVYYGSNDGIFHAINGNQSTAMGSVPGGGELWGLLLTEHYGDYNRLRINSPEMKYPSTTLASAATKDYFVDGPTGVYQKLTSSNTIDEAYIYLTMRRGGKFIYALDVSTPTAPVFKWRIDNSVSGFSELGQTWSRPKLTPLQSPTYSATPVMVFGAGYDPAEDDEPPSADTQGRGIYIIDAKTKSLIWSAAPSCSVTACKAVPDMKYAVPGEVTFVDRDGDGYTDKMYFTDVGGQVWRVDVTDADAAHWTVTKIAALGCDAAAATDTGICASGTTPRKFFFPPSVLTVGAGGASGSVDLISVASGDREHPLKDISAGSAYNVTNRFYTIVDTGTSLGTPATHDVTEFTLQNVTSGDEWDSTTSPNGFRITFATGEKAVNAPTAVNGFIFFATNKPASQDASCIANLGIAQAYAVSPFFGTVTTNTLQGGGLPPTAVSGVILITKTNPDGTTTTTQEKFCIGCGVSGLDATTGKIVDGASPTAGGDCGSSIGPCKPVEGIPKQLKRTYWYRK
jgi:type IV pilus assembly protein PilY1